MNHVQLLKDLGLNEEQIIDKVVGQIADQMLYGKIEDLDYDEMQDGGSTQFRHAVDALLKKRIDAAVECVANKHTLPNITEYLENFCIQKTNEWGESKGEPVTFVEYLTQRAEAYIAEPVDLDGNSKGESRFGNWRMATTRVTHLIDKHLRREIDKAMKSAIEDANKSIAGGLNEAVKIAINNLKVHVDTKVSAK